MKKIALAFAALFLCATSLFAGGGKDSAEAVLMKELKYLDSVQKAMKYEKGKIELSNGITQLNVPKGFKFLNAEQSNFVLSSVWGNPPQTGVLGMIFPDNSSPIDQGSYAFIITYEEMGYVKDDDADKINYDDLLKQIQEEEVAENKSRALQGYGAINMVGWASKPFYDKEKKVLHWAKNLKFADADENTLNYEVRILGRKGILSMNAVAKMTELDSVKKNIDVVLAMPSFKEGSAYKDFDSKTDNIAAWTIGSLVAGKILLKVGFLAGLGKILLASWKFILIGLAALGGGIKKFFGKKKDTFKEDA
jgi:uncharacterized membrane-anchored protein